MNEKAVSRQPSAISKKRIEMMYKLFICQLLPQTNNVFC